MGRCASADYGFVLCSARVEGGNVPSSAVRACRSRYLEAQLGLLPNATVAAIGSKARHRLNGTAREVIATSAATPPECNRPTARQAWEELAERIRARVRLTQFEP